MNKQGLLRTQMLLLAGDVLLLGLVTLVGFASHNQLQSAGLRMLTTFLPLVAAWLVAAPPLQLYNVEQARSPRQLWRPIWAMILAAPLAGLLRAIMLQSLIVPVFVLVLAGVGAAGLLLWRGIFAFWLGRYELRHG
jgi:hypothetical protein